MKSRDIIIHLITQDMKHNQLLSALRNTGLNPREHYLSIINIVITLMGGHMESKRDWSEIGDDLSNLYFGFIEKAEKQKFTGYDEDLKPLAEACYQSLSKYLSHI